VAHVLVGEPVSTSPEHALASVNSVGDARAVIRRYNATSSVIGRDRSPMCGSAACSQRRRLTMHTEAGQLTAFGKEHENGEPR
jgi:hypothetical protein